MRMLLDTHAFLWFVLGDSQLSSPAQALIVDAANEKLVSPASYWEIAIKISVGKYRLHEPYDVFMQRAISQSGFGILAVDIKHSALLIDLPYHHRDPFDRLLVAQAISEQVPILSSDSMLDPYPITRLW
jgi:PIN domain nuclease of toxin-antitoxin system